MLGLLELSLTGREGATEVAQVSGNGQRLNSQCSHEKLPPRALETSKLLCSNAFASGKHPEHAEDACLFRDRQMRVHGRVFINCMYHAQGPQTIGLPKRHPTKCPLTLGLECSKA